MIFEDNGISSDSIELNGALIKEIQRFASAVHDYRHPSYVKHKLSDIIMIVFLQHFPMQMNGQKLRVLQRF